MNFFTSLIKSSFADIKRNKIRTFLTSLGILIGVLSVVLLIAFGLGLKNYIRDQFNSLGTNLIVVLPGKILSGGGFKPGSSALGGVKFDDRDVEKLARIPTAEAVVPVFTKSVDVSALGKTESADLYATTNEIFVVRNLTLDKGSLFTKADNEKRAKKIVVGSKIAEKLFGTADNAIGKQIRLENQSFVISGVLTKKGGGGFGGPDLDSFVYLPYKTAESINPDKKFLALYAKARSEDDVKLLKAQMEQVLGKRYKTDDFSVIEQTEILNVVNSIFGVLNGILVAIGSISLVVGGIGIMNIMYASVTERIKEIGIRRAIGATKRDILLQFMSQAVMLSLFGGLIGIALAFLIVLAIQSVFPAAISPASVLIALGVSTAIGVFFGVFPARKAANLSPIDAIRYE